MPPKRLKGPARNSARQLDIEARIDAVESLLVEQGTTTRQALNERAKGFADAKKEMRK